MFELTNLYHVVTSIVVSLIYIYKLQRVTSSNADSIFSIVVDQYKITFVNRSADFYQMHITKYHIIYIEFSPCLTVFSLISCSCFGFSCNSQIACFNFCVDIKSISGKQVAGCKIALLYIQRKVSIFGRSHNPSSTRR